MSEQCQPCNSGTGEWPGPLEDRFEILTDQLLWNDGPLAGVAVCRSCGQHFAFQCWHEVWNQVIEWRMIPVLGPRSADPEIAFAEEGRAATKWLRVFDDQRPERRTSVASWVLTSAKPIDWYVPENVEDSDA